MKNQEIRELIAKRRLKHYEVADALGIGASYFSLWLRKELPEEKKKRVIDAINSIE